MAGVPRAWAQTFEVVHWFTVPAWSPDVSLIRAADGTFWGTAVRGGGQSAGAVFKIDSAGNYADVHVFTGPDGASPSGPVVQGRDGKFYGLTSYGGSTGYGVAYRVDATGAFAVLHTFQGSDGSTPAGGLVQAADGTFYGTTSEGGASTFGTIFKMTEAGAVTTLRSFSGADGVFPVAGLAFAGDGKLYGTTQAGGSGGGTVFRIDTAGGSFLTIRSLAAADGTQPSAALVLANDAKLYGTAKSGGASGFGAVFRVDTAGNFATVRSLAAADGTSPIAPLVQGADSLLYGTAVTGGTNDFGTVFRVNLAGTTITTLHSFAGADGKYPFGGLVFGTDGNLYGTTNDGGANGPPYGAGTLFRLPTTGGAVTTLHDFGGPSTGFEPSAPLFQASNGLIYGTTYRGGADNVGTVFSLSTAGAFAVVHAFAGPDGANPWSALAAGPDGKLWGLTNGGGATDHGAAYRIDSGGVFSLAHSFDGTDGFGFRDTGLVTLSADGKLYGLSLNGGANGFGDAFRMDTAGNVTKIHDFNITDGAYPYSGLLLAPDGNFYATTESGGTPVQGNVFRMTPAGVVAPLHEFNHTAGMDDDGMFPYGGLVRGSDGAFYGTTHGGGAAESGTVYRVTSAGVHSTLHSFTGADGLEPYGALVAAADGKLYGTTYRGGANDKGVVFRLDVSGANFSVLHSFDGSDGAGPVGGLVQATDGKLYGVANQAGPGGSGVVYRFSTCTPPAPPTAGNDGPICAGGTLHLTASTVPGATYAWTGPNGFSSSLQNPSIANATPAASGTYAVTVTVGGCTSAAATTNATVSFCGTKLFPVTPCRLVDTRQPNGPRGGPAIAGGGSRTFLLTGVCNVPAGVAALSLNVTVTQPTSAGNLKLYAAGTAAPVATALSYGAGQTRANNAIAAPDVSGNLTVGSTQPSGTVHVVLDVNGYFK